MADDSGQGLLDGVENKVAAASDDYRATLPPDARTEYDIKIGIAKGTYGFTKSLVSGLIDLTTFTAKLVTGDYETQKKVGEAAWGVTKFVARAFYYDYIASPEEKKQFEQEINDKANAMYQSAKSALSKEWEHAKKEGKEAELISKWATRGVLEVASIFVGAAEVKAAAKAAEAEKLSETAKVVKATVEACETTDVSKVAAQTKKAVDAVPDAAKSLKAVPEAKGPAVASEAANLRRAETTPSPSDLLSDGRSMPPGTKKVVYDDGEAVYFTDEKGRTIRAEGEIDPPDEYEKLGPPKAKPEGFIDGVDHRGHLVPERAAANQEAVNVPENIIPEHWN